MTWLAESPPVPPLPGPVKVMPCSSAHAEEPIQRGFDSQLGGSRQDERGHSRRGGAPPCCPLPAGTGTAVTARTPPVPAAGSAEPYTAHDSRHGPGVRAYDGFRDRREARHFGRGVRACHRVGDQTRGRFGADVCVPLPDGNFDRTAAADRLGMSIVADPERALWAIGPETLGGRALASADASDFALPDLDGNLVPITSLRGPSYSSSFPGPPTEAAAGTCPGGRR